MQYFDILLFAVIAGVLLVRLHRVLGRRTGSESPPPAPAAVDPVAPEPEVPAAPAAAAEDGGGADVRAGLAAIRRADPGFDLDWFVEGAGRAFRIIVAAFAAGDRERIRPLLADPVFRSFDAAIAEREREGLARETELVEMHPTTVEAAHMDGTRAVVTVQFETEKIDVTRDREGNVVEGDADIPERTTDLWTFARDTARNDPNWLLIRTGA